MLKCCVCLFCSPNSSTVVLASFCSASADFFHSNFGHPPNMVTCIHPGPKFKAVAVCLNRGCAPSGRVSWGEIRSWVLFWAHGKNPAIDLGSEPRTVWILASHSYHSKPLGHQRRERQATRAALPRGLPSLLFWPIMLKDTVFSQSTHHAQNIFVIVQPKFGVSIFVAVLYS